MTAWTCPWSVPEFDAEALGLRTMGYSQQISIPLNLSASALRVELSNWFGTQPLHIVSTTLLIDRLDGASTRHQIAVNGATSPSLAPRTTVWSDPIEASVGPGDVVRIALQPRDGTLVSGMRMLFEPFTAMLETTGEARLDRPEVQEILDAMGAMRWIFGVRAIAARSTAPVKAVVAFGDSLTHMDTWVAPLGRRMALEVPGGATLRNAGVAGNRVLRDGGIPVFGEAAVTRIHPDALRNGPVDALIVLEGINDLAQPVVWGRPDEVPTAAELIAGLTRIAGAAHDSGTRVLGGTLMPYGASDGWSEAGEAIRHEVNSWIRTTSTLDGLIDFDLLVRDPTAPTQLRSDFHTGDWLHLNPAAGEQVAAQIDLADLLGE